LHEWQIDAGPPITDDELAQWLGIVLQETGLGGPDLLRVAGPGLLSVGGGAKVQAEVRRLVAALAQALTPQYELRLFVMPPQAAAAGAGPLLQPPDVDRLLARYQPVRTHLLHLTGGLPQLMTAGAHVPLLHDWSVEVAQAAGIADPQVSELVNGLLLVAGAWPLPDGQILVLAAGRDTAVEQPIPSRPLGAKELGTLQFPRAHSAVRMFRAAVVDGGGALVGDGDRPGSLWLLQVRTSRKAAEPPAAFEFLPLPRLHLRRDLSLPDDAPPGSSQQFLATESGSHGNAELRGLLMEANHWNAWGSADIDEQPLELPPHEARVLLLRAGLLLAGDEARREPLRHWARAIASGTARTASLQLRAGWLPQERANAVLDGRTPAAEVAGALALQAVLPAGLGQTFRYVTGSEQSFVADYQVEIAQEKTTLDPVVESRFSGYLLEGQLLPLTDGRVRFVGRFEAGRPTAPMEPLATGNDNVGTFELHGGALVADRPSVLLDGNEDWRVLCCQSVPGFDEALVAVIRLRW
jgi:hypothetical protein